MSHQTRYLYVMLLAVTCIAVAARLVVLSGAFITFDEFLSIGVTELNWAQIATGQYWFDSHPPLYYLALKSVRSATQDAELPMRLLSLVAGCFVPPVAFLVARRFVGTFASLGVAALYATNTILCYQSVVVRGYSLLTLLSLIAFGAAVAGFHTGRRGSLITFACAALAATYTHYLGIVTVVFGYVCVFAYWAHLRVIPRGDKIVCLAMTTILCAPVSVFAVNHMAHTPYMHVLGSIQFDPEHMLWPVGMFNEPAQLPSSASLFIGLLFACIGFATLWRGDHVLSALTLGIAVVTISTLFFVISLRIATIPYYSIHVLFFAATLICAPLDYLVRRQAPRLTKWYALILTGAILGSGWLSFTTDIWRKYVPDANWRDVASVVRANQTGEERLVILGWDAISVAFYLQQQDWLNSYQFSDAIAASCGETYLLLDSPFGRHEAITKTALRVMGVPEGAELWRFKC